MKKLLLRMGIGLVVLLIVGLAVLFFSINSIVKKGVETVAPAVTKVDVRLGGANISPLSGSGSLSDLFVGNPEGFKTPSAIQVGRVVVAVKVASVLSDKIVVERVYVKDPVITYELGLGGNNISKILANVQQSSGGGAASSSESKPGKKVEVVDFQIEGGKIKLSTGLIGGKTVEVPLPPIHLQNIGTGGAGVTGPELARQIMTALNDSVLTAAKGAISNVGSGVKGLGDKATGGLKGLFK